MISTDKTTIPGINLILLQENPKETLWIKNSITYNTKSELGSAKDLIGQAITIDITAA